ncbi:MAG TPA: diguanylate cyclase [Clostridia bacterium]|nr:diguanylate cyclase [Clostridia bacterium]
MRKKRTGAFYVIYIWLVIVLGIWYMVGLFPLLDLTLWKELAVFVLLGVLADYLVVVLPHGQLSGAFAVILASYIIYGVPGAVWVTGMSALLGQVFVIKDTPLRAILFNVSQSVLSFAAALYVYQFLGGAQPGSNDILTPVNLLLIVFFSFIYYLSNHLLVYFYMFPRRLYYPATTLRDALKWDGFTYLFTVPFGVSVYMLYGKTGLLGAALLFLPVLVIQVILRFYVRVELANRELTALYEIAGKFGSAREIREVLELVLKESRMVHPYHTGVVYVWSDEKRAFLPECVNSPYAKYLKATMIHEGVGVIGWAIRNKMPEVIFDTKTDPRFANEEGINQYLRSLVMVPLMSEAEVLGLLLLGDRSPYSFELKHMQTLTIISGLASAAVAKTISKGRLDSLAITDGATGLYNHRYFKLRIEALHETATRGLQYAVLVVVLDNYEYYSDKFEEEVWQGALTKLSKVIGMQLKTGHLLARYGKQEFVVLMPDTAKEDAVEVAHLIRQAVRSNVFSLGEPGRNAWITVSTATVSCPDDAMTGGEILGAVDQTIDTLKKEVSL